jgi:hypothetical protein
MNEINVNANMKLAENAKYMRHIPSGRVYPYELNGAKRDDVEIFVHKQKGDVKINKPPKAKSKGPFQRDRASDAFDAPTSSNLEIVTE